jgi:hypothetical protein
VEVEVIIAQTRGGYAIRQSSKLADGGQARSGC